MIETTRTTLIVLSGLVLLAGAPPALGQGTNEPGEIPGAARRAIEQVEEVTVTARKRVERLEDTPVSVTALGETVLRDANVQRLDDITPLVPNLQFLTFRSGMEAQVYIRGVGQLDSLITTDPGVAIYVDGVYLSRAQGSVLQLFDIDRIEVLRGPQGTLFGKNTAGGAINVLTVKPQEELSGSAALRVGNFDTVDTRLTLNVPVSVGPLKDKLFSRFSFLSANSEGYTENTFRNEHSSNRNAVGMVGSLRFLPTDDIELDLNGMWSRDHARGKGGQCVFVQPGVDAVQGLLQGHGFKDACEATEPLKFQADTAPLVDIESYGTWGNLTWNAGDAGPVQDLAVKSITSWREQVPRIREDLDMTALRVASIASIGGSELDGAPGFARQVSQEFQVNGRAFDGRLTSVAGLYGFWEVADSLEVTRTLNFADPGAPPDPAEQLVQQAGATFRRDIKADNWTYAVYTQSTFDITKALSLTAGVRWSIERKAFDSKVEALYWPVGDRRRVLLDGDNDETFDALTPMASLAFRVPEDLLAATPLSHLMPYFTYSQGFKSGGFNGNARLGKARGTLDPYDPESVNSYELGVKTIGFDKRASLNLALFLSEYSDIQVIGTRGSRTSLVVDRVVFNAAEATMKGLETELELRPFTGMTLLGSVALLDATYDKFPTAVDALTGEDRDRSGESFNSVPDFTSTVTAQYTTPLQAPGRTWLSGWLTPRLQYSYKSAVNYIGPEVPQARQSGYGLLGARLSYDFNDDQAQFALWASNLTDERYFGNVLTGITATTGHLVRYYDSPRAFGVEASYRF